MKLALALIVKPTDEEAEYLKNALNSVAPYVDGIFVTITGDNKRCEEVAQFYGANISRYEWDYSFANARNYNFSQVPKEYTHILWMDADDIFRGLDKLKPVLEQKPELDGFIFNYLYSFDEYGAPSVVHMKTQVVKNGSVTWVGELHEDFEQHRELSVFFVEGIERIHTSKPERYDKAAERNLEISKKIMEKQPNDPRSYWNLANALWGSGKIDEAREMFEQFLKVSESEEEKYLAHIYIANMYLYEGQYSKALDSASYAIGIRPQYPNAYTAKGHIYAAMQDWTKARDLFQMALVCIARNGVPKHSIIVYNPREYDYVPLMALAKCYFHLQFPELALECLKGCQKIQPENKDIEKMVNEMEREVKEVKGIEKALEKLDNLEGDELKKAIDDLPVEFRSHPAVCKLRNIHFAKAESSGKDVVFNCGYSFEEWNPAIVKEKGIGGSEEAVINLSRELVKRGWNVTVYNNCGSKEQVFEGVVYRPYWSYNYRDRQDITVCWRNPRLLDYDINSKKVYLDLHDVVMPGEFTEDRMKKVDKVFVKSQAQRELYPHVPSNKFTVVPNGVDMSLFDKKVKRDPYYLVQFSSPDRALEETLDILEEVRKRLPKDIAKKVKFAWHYGWGVFDASNTSAKQQEWKLNLQKRFDNLKKEGWVEGGGRINHEQVAIENLKAGALVYPSEFFEIDWVGGTKALIAGCIPITTDFAAIGEKVRYGLKVESHRTKEDWADIKGESYGIRDEDTKEKYIALLVEYLKNPEELEELRKQMAEYARERYNWEKVADVWHDELSSLPVPDFETITSIK